MSVSRASRAKSRYGNDRLRRCAWFGCSNPPRAEGQRYCSGHHAEYQREWRAKHPHEGTRRRKAEA